MTFPPFTTCWKMYFITFKIILNNFLLLFVWGVVRWFMWEEGRKKKSSDTQIYFQFLDVFSLWFLVEYWIIWKFIENKPCEKFRRTIHYLVELLTTQRPLKCEPRCLRIKPTDATRRLLGSIIRLSMIHW